MQQKMKTPIALGIGTALLVAASAANATAYPVPVTITAVSDVQIVEDAELNFGTRLYTTAGQSCAIDADQPGDAIMQVDNSTPVAQGPTYGDITGAGCINATGQTAAVGRYRLTGVDGQTVVLSITGIPAGGDFSFVPAGCISSYDGTVANDTCITYSGDVVAVPFKLAAATATEHGSAANTLAGQLVFTVGGQVTVGATNLNPDQPYSAQFTVDVVYQ